jgi:NADH:ubiquinone oxidoreductase subunit 6 (subunit J)
MLTSKSPFSHFEPRAGEVVIAVAVSVVLFAALVMAVRAANFQPGWLETREQYPIGALGQALLGDYLVPFELASVVLLVVMIGAAYLAKGRRREVSPPTGPQRKPTVILSKKAREWS